jgi:Flp pilus assembly pilin Flp
MDLGPHRSRASLIRRLRDARGASFIEYILLVGILALGLIVGFKEARRREDKAIAHQAWVIKRLEKVTAADIESSLSFDIDDAWCTGGVCVNPNLNGGAADPNACFGEGTLVATGDGLRPIETIREGDLLLSRDESTGVIDLRPVVKRYVTPHQPVIELRLDTADGGETLHATPGHRFWVTGDGWRSAEDLSVSGGLWVSSGEPVHLGLPIVPSVEYATVYNFEVADYHTYFVGRHGVWVHNGIPPADKPLPDGWKLCNGKPVPKGYFVTSHGKQPVPRSHTGPGAQTWDYESHHGMLSAWMEAHYKDYNPNLAPSILLPTPEHRKTVDETNPWMKEMKDAGHVKNGKLDWSQISEEEMREFAEYLLELTNAPQSARDEYWRLFDYYQATLHPRTGAVF